MNRTRFLAAATAAALIGSAAVAGTPASAVAAPTRQHQRTHQAADIRVVPLYAPVALDDATTTVYGARSDATRFTRVYTGSGASKVFMSAAARTPSAGSTGVSASSVQPAASWTCSVIIGRLGWEYEDDSEFDWSVEQVCSGDFGSQFVLGWLAYAVTGGYTGYTDRDQYPTKATPNSFVGAVYYAHCGTGGSTHTYRGAGEGANAHGFGPDTYSTNSLTHDCGTGPD